VFESLTKLNFNLLIKSLTLVLFSLLALHTYSRILRHDLMSLLDISTILPKTYVSIYTRYIYVIYRSLLMTFYLSSCLK
jgi:hypothetical protein